jgi:hypothetical protein
LPRTHGALIVKASAEIKPLDGKAKGQFARVTTENARRHPLAELVQPLAAALAARARRRLDDAFDWALASLAAIWARTISCANRLWPRTMLGQRVTFVIHAAIDRPQDVIGGGCDTLAKRRTVLLAKAHIARRQRRLLGAPNNIREHSSNIHDPQARRRPPHVCFGYDSRFWRDGSGCTRAYPIRVESGIPKGRRMSESVAPDSFWKDGGMAKPYSDDLRAER